MSELSGGNEGVSPLRKGYSKLTVILFRRQVALLDQLAVDMRERHGVTITRSAIIAALIDLDETKQANGATRRKRRGLHSSVKE
jgi:hypothetical protein